MADNPTGEGGAPEVPATGSDEWAPGAIPQFAGVPEAPPEPVTPKAVQQPGGPDMIQVPKIDPETGAVQQPAAPAPVAVPAPVAGSQAPPAAVDYTQYAAPAYAAPTAPKRKRIPWWVWVIIGGVVLLGAIFAIVVVLVLQQLNQGHSPDYTGAPIASTEQGATPAPTATGGALDPTPAGDNEVISESGAVAYVLPEGWVDAHDYVDLSSLDSTIEEGQFLNGAYFTGDPDTLIPQLVLVLESAPSISNAGTFDNQIDQYLKGFKGSVESMGEATRTPVTTANGLEGLQADFAASYPESDVQARVTVFGNGQRLVFVQFISYSGPIDEAAYSALVDSLRVEP